MPELIDSLVIGLNALAAALVVGAPLFGLLALRPAYTANESLGPDAGDMTGTLRRLLLAGVGLTIVTTGIAALAQAAPIPGQAEPGLMGVMLGQYMTTLGGGLLVLRVGLALLAGLVAGSLPTLRGGRMALWWGAALLGLCAIITFSLQRYAAALDRALPVILDAIWLLAVSIWAGGLIGLAAVLAGKALADGAIRLSLFRPLIARFGLLALVSVDLLALGGLANIAGGTQATDALNQADDSRTVAIKIGLLLTGLGAIHLLALAPRLFRRRYEQGGQPSLRLDLAGVTAALIAAGLLTIFAPHAGAPSARQLEGFIGYTETDDVGVLLRVAPATAGDNAFQVDVIDHRGGSEAAPAQVILHLRMAADSSGGVLVQTASSDGAHFTTRGSYLTIEGDWLAEVILRRGGQADMTQRFIVPVKVDPARAEICGAMAEPAIPNPVPADEQSIEAGHALYTENCAPCHGASGRGDGPVGLTLNPRPADLTKHTLPGVHTDGRLYLWITDGYPDSVMPAFAKYLSDTDRWRIVNYIRTFASDPERQ